MEMGRKGPSEVLEMLYMLICMVAIRVCSCVKLIEWKFMICTCVPRTGARLSNMGYFV